LLAANGPLPAMVVKDRDFVDLVERAEQILSGTVSAVEVSHDASGSPVTHVRFVDLVVLKGTVEAPFTLELYGGSAVNGGVRISGTPRFEVGERAFVFVAGNGRRLCPLVGVWQGLFRVRFDADSGVEVVENHARLPVVGRRGRQLRVARRSTPGAPPPLAVDEFRDLISNELRRQRRAGGTLEAGE
jgi:hypothetical protein